MEEFVWKVEQAYAEYMAKRPDPNSKEFDEIMEVMKRVRWMEREIEGMRLKEILSKHK